jgi:quercetin dioxygenase-like cupin family protein
MQFPARFSMRGIRLARERKEVSMKRTILILALGLAVGIVVGTIGSQVLSAQQDVLKRTVLLRHDLVGMEGKEGMVIMAEAAPGVSAGKHYHPGHELAYVLEGSGTFEMEGKAPITLKAGDTLYVPPKVAHDAKNTSATAPLKILVFFIAEKGQPLAVEAK